MQSAFFWIKLDRPTAHTESQFSLILESKSTAFVHRELAAWVMNSSAHISIRSQNYLRDFCHFTSLHQIFGKKFISCKL